MHARVVRASARALIASCFDVVTPRACAGSVHYNRIVEKIAESGLDHTVRTTLHATRCVNRGCAIDDRYASLPLCLIVVLVLVEHNNI